MRVNICEPKMDYTVEAGDLIITKHHKGRTLNYMVVKDNDDLVTRFRLLNLESSNIMAGFSTRIEEDIFTYITRNIKCEILGIIPASKLELGLK